MSFLLMEVRTDLTSNLGVHFVKLYITSNTYNFWKFDFWFLSHSIYSHKCA